MNQEVKTLSRSRGFTLIELIFVVMIIALMSFITLPRISNLFGINLRTSAVEVKGYLRRAYEQAVMRHERLRVRFDLAKGTYWAETYEEAPSIPLLDENTKLQDAIKTFEEQAEKPDATLEERLAEEQSRYKKVDAGELKATSLPGGIKFKGVYSGGTGKIIDQGAPTIEFTPGGFVPKTVVYVTNDREDVFSIVLKPLGGESTIEKGEIRPDDV